MLTEKQIIRALKRLDDNWNDDFTLSIRDGSLELMRQEDIDNPQVIKGDKSAAWGWQKLDTVMNPESFMDFRNIKTIECE